MYLFEVENANLQNELRMWEKDMSTMRLYMANIANLTFLFLIASLFDLI